MLDRVPYRLIVVLSLVRTARPFYEPLFAAGGHDDTGGPELVPSGVAFGAGGVSADADDVEGIAVLGCADDTGVWQTCGLGFGLEAGGLGHGALEVAEGTELDGKGARAVGGGRGIFRGCDAGVDLLFEESVGDRGSGSAVVHGAGLSGLGERDEAISAEHGGPGLIFAGEFVDGVGEEVDGSGVVALALGEHAQRGRGDTGDTGVLIFDERFEPPFGVGFSGWFERGGGEARRQGGLIVLTPGGPTGGGDGLVVGLAVFAALVECAVRRARVGV